jgi:hypothetical protein
MSSLVVQYCGERYEVPTSKEFSIGRSGDLAVDQNPFLHRIMGTFIWRSGWWWLANVGARHPLHLQGLVGSTTITLSPGASVPLVFGPTYIRFAAGGTTYEVGVDVVVDPFTPPSKAHPSGDRTIDSRDTPLTADELLLLVALAEPRLRRGLQSELPTNAELMARFGWSEPKFNRKLDNMCAKFAANGLPELVGSANKVAQGRRRILVNHVVDSGMVTVEQIVLLPPRISVPQPRGRT